MSKNVFITPLLSTFFSKSQVFSHKVYNYSPNTQFYTSKLKNETFSALEKGLALYYLIRNLFCSLTK